MAYKATVIPGGAGMTLIFTDLSSVSGTLVSKILNITDGNGVLIKTVNMGVHTDAEIDLVSDLYLTFTMTLTDTAGVHVVIVNYLSTVFYEITFASVISKQGCACNCGCSNKLNMGEQFKSAARIEAQLGLKSASQANIVAANAIINS